MTRNNLNEHLEWLLSARQSASTFSVPNYEVLSVRSIQEVQVVAEPIDIGLNSASQELEALTIHNATTATLPLEPPLAKGPDNHSLPRSQADMARLQSQPRPLKRPQVPSQESPSKQQLPSPPISTSRGKMLVPHLTAVTESPKKGSILCSSNYKANQGIRDK